MCQLRDWKGIAGYVGGSDANERDDQALVGATASGRVTAQAG
jgi:hypothetical protein